MQQPEDYGIKGKEQWVLKLKKTIYSLKQKRVESVHKKGTDEIKI